MRRFAIAVSFLGCLLAISPACNAGTFVVATEAEQVRLMLELRAQQFLNRASFGATDADITRLANNMASVGIQTACENWVDEQFAKPTTLHMPTMLSFMASDGIVTTGATPNFIDNNTNPLRYRYHAFWHNAIAADDQLKQRLAWALLQIFVIGEGGNDFNFVEIPTGQPYKPFYFGVTTYYDKLLDKCDDTFLDVLTDVTNHPIMGMWLSSLRNRKATSTTFPDENYAREVLQLFSIGLNELNLDGSYKLDGNGEVIPTYDNVRIGEFAKVFTGFNFAGGSTTNIDSGDRNFLDNMIMVNNSHDTGAKTLLNGTVLPARTNGTLDITEALKNIEQHPNVGPFISRLLIQRLVRSNPSKGYIERVATVFNNNGAGKKGDFKAVVKAILTDNEAWSSIRMTRLRNPTRLVVASAGTEFGRLAEPLVQYAGFFRRYGSPPATGTNGKFYLNSAPENWNQAPFRSPSVFNFYLPHYQPAGGVSTAVGSRNIPTTDQPNPPLFAPEFQILTAVTSNSGQNRARNDVVAETFSQSMGTTPAQTHIFTFNFASQKTLANSPAVLVEYLDKVLCNGVITDEFKNKLSVSIGNYVLQTSTNTSPTFARDRDRNRGAMITIMNSPYYLIRY